MGRDDIGARMQALLDSLQYDFKSFTIAGFVEWVARSRGRPIAFVPRNLPEEVFGAWVKGTGVSVDALLEVVPSAVIFGANLSDNGLDVVFYEPDTPIVHQGHNQLHEASHIICDHPTVDVDEQQTQGLLRSAGPIDPTALDALLLRSTHSDEHEREAETLTNLIQERAFRHARLEELHKAISVEDKAAAWATNYITEMEGYE